MKKKRRRIEKKTNKCWKCKIPISRRAKSCGSHGYKPSGENHSSWKGEKVGYVSLHKWVARHRGKPEKCENCGTTKAKKFEWANISGKYRRILTDWIRLCTSCHHKSDEIQKRGWVTRKRYAN